MGQLVGISGSYDALIPYTVTILLQTPGEQKLPLSKRGYWHSIWAINDQLYVGGGVNLGTHTRQLKFIILSVPTMVS